ncbi:MAG TPA: host attachment family protein [Paracoccaceae bacterium]|nr:host attachment family protein [Paracoccaceae bacterium]
MKLPEKAWVVVADGEKYLALKNHGPAHHIDLRVLRVEETEIARTSAQGVDRPGRQAKPGGRRSAIEQTDWARLSKEAFASGLAEWLNRAALNSAFPALVLVADPRTLGALRPHLHGAVRERLAAEIVGDHAHETVPAIEELIRKF